MTLCSRLHGPASNMVGGSNLGAACFDYSSWLDLILFRPYMRQLGGVIPGGLHSPQKLAHGTLDSWRKAII